MKLNKKLILTFSAFFGIAIGGSVVETDKNVVYAGENHLGCNSASSDAFAQRFADTQKWKDYIASLGIPEYIPTDKGNKAWIQKDKSISECMPIYGTPALVSDNLAKRQTQELQNAGGQSFYKYQGLTIKGTPYLDSRYVEEGNSYDYMKTGNFIYHPWDHNALKKSIESSTVKPFVIHPKDWGKTEYRDPVTNEQPSNIEILDRSVDRRYTQFCDKKDGDNCENGIYGYLKVPNDITLLPWTGNQLGNYVSFEVVPGQYDPGIWNIYRLASTGVYYYNPSYTKPFTLLVEAKTDLKITINKITPSKVKESTYIVVAYSICNEGDSVVYKPTIKYGDATSSTPTVRKLDNIQLLAHKCVNGEIWDVARKVDADTTATYRMEVNPDKTNPSNENNWTNNVSTKQFTIINRVVDLGIEITSVTPTIPYSNQTTTINYEITNRSNVDLKNVVYSVGYEGRTVQMVTDLSAANEETGEPYVYSGSIVQTATPVAAYTDTVKVLAEIIAGGEEEGVDGGSDNSDIKIVTIQNPDAYVLVKGVNDGDNTLSKVNITVYNKMFKGITNNCGSSAAGCLSGTSNKTFTYQIYDTKMTDTLSDDVLIKNYTTSTYSLAHDGKQTFSIPKNVITDWVDSNYPDSYQAVQFRVVATIPNYSVEVDWDGVAQYGNNTDTKYFTYIPPRDVAFNACTQIKHNNASYFTYTSSDKVSVNKICAGHYPTYPSTKVENGMQAYHYVLYRFLAQPIPRYEITTIQTDATNANYFTQITKLQDVYESKTVRGDSDSMIFTKNTVNGYNVERGRYVPTGGTFNFSIYEKKNDGSQGKQIAIGTVTHQIPSTCYDKEYLDIANQTGCNDVVFFLPNADSGDAKYKKPANYTSADIKYPITKTRVPYLNPGNYTFSFEGVETFKYYYQTNLSKDAYNWSNPKFK